MTSSRSAKVLALLAAGAAMLAGDDAAAQSVGTFRWQLQPYCNVVTVAVVQGGGGYTLDGWDDQCGAASRAPLVGGATLNPDGSVQLGLHIVTSPGAVPIHVAARLTLPTASGTWHDSAGGSGAFVLTAGAGSGPPRPDGPPAGDNDLTRLGVAALGLNTSGTSNTAVGAAALAVNTYGSFNTATGAETLRSNIGSENTAFGAFALRENLDGRQNVAVGVSAMRDNRTGGRNAVLGYEAMARNLHGGANVATGHEALAANLGGSYNTASGALALLNSSGSGNTAIGAFAGHNLTAGAYNVYLDAEAGSATESSTMRLGTGVSSITPPVTRTFAGGIRGVTTGVNDAVAVVIDSNGQLGTMSSSARAKTRIETLGSASRRIHDLRPVRFVYRRPFADGSTPVQYGLIAEEVADVLPELVARGADGQIETVKYHVLPTLLLSEVQRLERERDGMQKALAAQAREIDELKTAVAQLLSTSARR